MERSTVSTSDTPTTLVRTATRALPSLGAATSERVPTLDRTTLAAPVRAVAFWTAALVPLVYLPLLASGLTAQQIPTLLGLMTLNAVSLVVGHGH
ncbi:hypothetical protein RYH80_07680 [Halobaculum sp. MBLA0147]|uniref:hypothetical protein n=1 Tax=Halobaculum sp. MBLA0147 TaxID=3079934 RepID=UPI0035258ED4